MTNLASPAQNKFITDLLAKRVVPADIANTIKAASDMTTRQASSFIDLLKSYPYAPKPVAGAMDDYLAALELVPNGSFAVQSDVLRTAFPSLAVTGDFTFLRVKTFKDRRYLRQLVGGANGGEFYTKHIDLPNTIGLLKFLSADPVAHMQKFGELRTCCGRCGKGLTDPVSRRMFLGPECRKALGL